MSLSSSSLDMEVPEARLWQRLPAAGVAAVVAPAMTAALISMAVAGADLLAVYENASPDLLSSALSKWALRSLREVIGTPVVGVVFGFPGALLFLATGFYIVRRRRLMVRGYMLAGAAIGLIHSAIGLSFRGLDALAALLPWDQRLAVFRFLGNIALIGSFALTSSPRPIVVGLTFLAAPLAGAVAGFAYGRILTALGGPGARLSISQ